MKLRINKGFVLRTVIACVVAGAAYGLVVALPRYIAHHRQHPHQQLSELRTAVNENYLALKNLANVPVTDVSVAQSLTDAHAQLVTSQKTLRDKLKKPSKELDTKTAAELNQLMKQESEVNADYEARFAVLQKALAYVPSENLGLDARAHTQVVINRAVTAHDALKKLADTSSWPLKSSNSNSVSVGSDSFSLGDDANTSLNVVVTCLANFGQQLSDKNFNQSVSTLASCNNTYNRLRPQLAQVVLAAFKSEAYNKTEAGLSKNIKAIDLIIH